MDRVVEEVACPKVPKRLPVILSPDELVRFFMAVSNPKHRAILMDSRRNRFARAKQFSRLFKQIHGLPPRELAARTFRATKAKRE